MHWTILGAGAIGCLWAAQLQRAGRSVSLILRSPPRLAEFRALGGITLVDDEGECFCPLGGELATASGPIGTLLLCTKAYDSESALDSVWHRLSPDSRILVLQNGLGSQQQVLARAGAARVLLGSTTDGAYLRKPFEVVHAGRGETAIGTTDKARNRDLLAELELTAGLGLQLRQDADIEATLWRKLAINCAINPLTALNGCRNGELARVPAYTHELDTLCAEFEAVASARGIQLFDNPLREQALAVARQTADNYSSMLQDMRHRRPTEIDQISGFLCREADRLGIAVPSHHRVLERVRQLQASYPCRSPS
jgi:2-dehydropantoate 2-reductase